jgi:hypothetical protein
MKEIIGKTTCRAYPHILFGALYSFYLPEYQQETACFEIFKLIFILSFHDSI